MTNGENWDVRVSRPSGTSSRELRQSPRPRTKRQRSALAGGVSRWLYSLRPWSVPRRIRADATIQCEACVLAVVSATEGIPQCLGSTVVRRRAEARYHRRRRVRLKPDTTYAKRGTENSVPLRLRRSRASRLGSTAPREIRRRSRIRRPSGLTWRSEYGLGHPRRCASTVRYGAQISGVNRMVSPAERRGDSRRERGPLRQKRRGAYHRGAVIKLHHAARG